MREITLKENSEKKKKRNQLILGLVLIFVMVIGTLGYAFQGGGDDSEDKKVNYNGFEFVKKNNFWVTKVGNFQFIFKYNPTETEKINSELKSLENYYNEPLYISSENYEAEAEIYMNLNQIAQRMQKACLKGEKCENKDLPIKTCEDNFIVVKEGNIVKIEQEENCVFIEGPEENLVGLNDEFLFIILGIEQ